MLQSFRYLLFPFSFLYGIVIRIRNYLYDKKWVASTGFNFPLICVGNLSLGGTGKSPMVEALIRILEHDYQVAVLSRGYMRKTKGFLIAQAGCTAIDIGDEPMQIHLKFPNVAVAVSEERLVGIPQLLHDRPATQVIILDDAMQHRKVNAGMNILLTEYANLYTRDYLFPTGDLRDEKRSAERANLIVVTKCPADLSTTAKAEIIEEVTSISGQKVFFTTYQYDQPYHLTKQTSLTLTSDHHVLLITGIANPEPLKAYLKDLVATYDMLKYRDHHIFTIQDLRDIKAAYSHIQSTNKVIITTEKDAVRLQKFNAEFEGFPIYVLPIKHQFLFDAESSFKQLLFSYVNKALVGC